MAEQLRPCAAAMERLDAIPGMGVRTGQIILAELVGDPSRFPSPRHLAAWAGVSPGNRESGGKRRTGRTRHGNPWLKAALTEVAWAAGHSKEGYLPAQFRRLAARRGKKRAIVAVVHSGPLLIAEGVSLAAGKRATGSDGSERGIRPKSKQATRPNALLFPDY